MADGGQTPFAGGKGTVLEGGFRAPCIVRWPGHVRAGKVGNGIMSGLDWFRAFLAAAGNPNIVDELKAGKQLGEQTYKVHLDGTINSTSSLAKSRPRAERFSILPKGHWALSVLAITSTLHRPARRRLGGTVKPDWPILTNLRLDPFERTGLGGSIAYFNWMSFEFWRFVLVQDIVMTAGQSFIEFPPEACELQSRRRQGTDSQAMTSHSGR